jgi:plasmid stabilization system protein ParE
MTILNHITLEAMARLPIAEIVALPGGELARLQREVEAARSFVRELEQKFSAALDYRYGLRARELRAAEAKDTGTVRFEDNGFIVVADLPKRVKWDQRRLEEIVDLIGSSWGEDPADYVKIKFEVSERAYDSWPARLKELFTPARTVETGKPSYELLPPDGRGT